MAFLQRVINGGGRIQREYGLGRRALDLLLSFGGRRYPIEIKLRRGERTRELGLKQLGQYLDGLGLVEGWLVIFDRRRKQSWEEKLRVETVSAQGKRIHVVGC